MRTSETDKVKKNDHSQRDVDAVVAENNRLRKELCLHDITERAAADERFRALFEHSTDPHLLFDDTGIIDCNDATFSLLGTSNKAQVLSLHPAALSPEFQPDGRRSMEKCLEMDATARRLGVHRFEWIHRKMDGTDFPVEVTITPVKVKGKEGMLVVWHDLSEQKRAEQELRKVVNELRHSKEQFHAFMDNSPILAWIKDQSGQYVYINRRNAERFHNSSPSLLGQLDSDLFPAELAVQFTREDRGVLEGATFSKDQTLTSRNGEILNWHVTKFPLTDSDGKHYAAGMAVDVTDQRRVEAALRENEERLRIALSAGAMGTFTVDLDRRVVIKDDVMNRLQGLDPAVHEWPMETCFSMAHPDDQATLRAAMEKIISAGFGDAVEYRVNLPDGSTRWLRCTGCLLGPQAPHLLVGVQLDITQRKLNEEMLIRARQDAEAANRAKSEFLANMSHEIRTPMTQILGFVDLLDKPEATPQERRQCIEVIRRNGEHLLSILNDVLDLSRIDAGKMSVEWITFSPADVIREVESLMRLRATQKGIGFAVEIRADTPAAILNDPTRLRQVLLNLVGNAIKFTEKGTVRLVVGPDQNPGDGKIRFDVVDTGIGLTPEQQEHLFTAFSQADTSTSRRFGGSGLGLAISKRLSAVLGGTLKATSKLHEGSTFSLTIDVGSPQALPPTPMSLKAAATKNSPQCDGIVPRLNGRILFAEDSADTRVLMRKVLEDAGLTVDVTKNGQAAIQRVKAAALDQNPYDLVLMDMSMPVLDGYAATRELRASGFKSLPIIAFTAHAMETEREKCEAAGCNGYLTKPIDRAAMLAAIAAHLPSQRHPLILSELSEDRLVKPLLPLFIANLANVIDELIANLHREDFGALRERVHKLKGAGETYGFPQVTQFAGEVEAVLIGNPDASKVAAAVDRLVDVLRRIEPAALLS